MSDTEEQVVLSQQSAVPGTLPRCSKLLAVVLAQQQAFPGALPGRVEDERSTFPTMAPLLEVAAEECVVLVTGRKPEPTKSRLN